MTTIYKLTLDNYHGETFFELYNHKYNAEHRYYELRNENKDTIEYEDGWTFSFFNPSYNEDSTFISLSENTLD